MEQSDDPNERDRPGDIFFKAIISALGPPARTAVEHDGVSFTHLWACGCEAHDGLRCSAIDWCEQHERQR